MSRENDVSAMLDNDGKPVVNTGACKSVVTVPTACVHADTPSQVTVALSSLPARLDDSGATVTVKDVLLSTTTDVGCVTVPLSADSTTEHVPAKPLPAMSMVVAASYSTVEAVSVTTGADHTTTTTKHA